jgi:hypothetical protein
MAKDCAVLNGKCLQIVVAFKAPAEIGVNFADAH